MSKSLINLKAQVKASIIAGFRHKCVEAIQLGYNRMIAEKFYQVDWEEDNLTICLVETIKKTSSLAQSHISVNYQTPIYSAAMAYLGASSLQAPRVDFKFSTFSKQEEYEYFAEAKNLSESDWYKASGSKVSASYYRARYIDTGIENYLVGRYPDGCLVGYIVNGKESNILAGLNGLISSRCASPRIGLLRKDSTVSFPICYTSDNQSSTGPITLRHLLLQLA